MAQRKTILIVDDEPDLRGDLAEQLREEFDIEEAGTGEAGLAAALAGKPDLIVLDVNLPDLDGREVCRRLKAAGINTPVIMLTAAASDADTIEGLDAGANAYVTKPFRVGVLLAHVRAQLRSHEQSEDAVFRIGPYEFRPAAKLLIDEKARKIRLTEKETNILQFLHAAGGTVPRETLLHEVWGYSPAVTTHTLETHIYRLRRKIEENPGRATILVTEGGGYRLG
jgi:DNA-binding response OmpR family regulator